MHKKCLRIYLEINNDNNNWEKILKDLLENRQRSIEEQHERYGQDFPETEIEIVPAKPITEEEEGS